MAFNIYDPFSKESKQALSNVWGETKKFLSISNPLISGAARGIKNNYLSPGNSIPGSAAPASTTAFVLPKSSPVAPASIAPPTVQQPAAVNQPVKQSASVAPAVSPASLPFNTTTYYKDGESISLTPEQAARQGGSSGLAASGWTTTQAPTQEPIPTPAADFSVPYTGTTSTKDIGSDVTTSKLDEILKQNAALQEKYLASLDQTQVETDLQTQIADLADQYSQKQAELQQYDLGTLQSTKDIMSGTGLLTTMSGKAGKLQEKRQFERMGSELQLQTLQNQYENLTNRLGIEQAKRQSTTEKFKALLGFGEKAQDTQLKIQDALQKQQSDYLSAIKDLGTQARANLSLILDKFKGLDYNELDENGKLQLSQLAIQSGIDPNIVVRGMEVAKNEVLAGNILSSGQLSPQQIQDAISKGYTTNDQLKLYASLSGTGQAVPMLKEPTEGQTNAALYANRLVQANQVIDELASKFTGVGTLIGERLPEILKGEERKLLEQAQRNFLNAVLRRESGAVISPTEFAEGKKQYFPQVSDTTAVLEQKRQNRLTAIEGLQNAAGRALQTGTDDPLNLGFNKPLSKGVNGSEISKIAAVIGQFESGSNYTKRGPVVQSGLYAGERAMGKYQIMPGNLPAWSKEALGRVVSEQEFMSNPQIQDQIAQYKMGQYYQKYGTVEDVATAWFAGPGAVGKNSQAKDVIGTSVPKYITNVKAIYNRLS